jgi:hypothetical protein
MVARLIVYQLERARNPYGSLKRRVFVDKDLSKLIAELGKYKKTTVETSYPLFNKPEVYAAVMGGELVNVHMREPKFPPECIVTIIYDRGEIAFSAFCVPFDVLAKLADPTIMPNYTEQKDYPYCSFTIGETLFRLVSISIDGE